MGSGISTFVSVLRNEGARAVSDRVLDRREGKKRLEQMPRVDDQSGTSRVRIDRAPVVNLSPDPPFPRRGGAQLQLHDRLEHEVQQRTVAHLYPIRERWHLECREKNTSELRVIDASLKDPAASLAGIRRAVATATRIAETEIVHIENPFGFPLEIVSRLHQDGYRIILSVHDFSLFCRRPHLIAEPGERFCGFETDFQRCQECLAADWLVEPGMLHTHKSAGAAALSAAETVVFPSEIHRDRHLVLFPESLDESRCTVINPATAPYRGRTSGAVKHPHLAAVGGLKRHKGGRLVEEVLQLVRKSIPKLPCTVFGDCEPELTTVIRRLPNVHIRGYYRAGLLPNLLEETGSTVAVFPSVAAESYGLVVDECLKAGVPVVAFDTGEVGERLLRLKAGIVVGRSEGAQGLADAIVSAIEEKLSVPEGIIDELPTPANVAQQYLELYREFS